MASQSTGIQQLLAAEKKSAEKVAEARKRTLLVWFRLAMTSWKCMRKIQAKVNCIYV